MIALLIGHHVIIQVDVILEMAVGNKKILVAIIVVIKKLRAPCHIGLSVFAQPG